MVEWLTDPFTLAILAIVVTFAIAVGLLRREPAWAIAGSAVGLVGWMLGFNLASRLGDEAFLAAVLASGGFGLVVEINHRMKTRRTAERTGART